ncbi:MAG: DUF11 domain-containing protein [Chloroflexi bacterium]|nr:DUF11 domain-containing protein [Chloroflexota bacterium]
MFYKTNVKSLLVQATLFTLVIVTGLWLGAWILSIPTSSASGALLAPLAFQSPIGEPELHVAKTVDNDSPEPGEMIDYTLTYSVTSTTGHPNPQAFDVRLYDFLPAGVEFVSSNPPGQYISGTVLITDDSVGLTDETVLVRARVLEGYEQLHNYTLAAATGVTPTHDSLLTTVAPASPLNLSKTSDPVTLINSDLIYTIQCENPSYITATSVTVMDVLPVDLSFVGAFPTPDKITLPLLSWSLGDLGPGESRTIVITTTTPALPSIITNTAMADAQHQVMTHTLFATQVISEGSILRVTKQGSSAVVDVGDELVYTLQYENIGNQDAIGTRLTDTLPVDVSVTGIYSTAGTFSSPPLVWELGTVVGGAPAEEILITVTVTGGWGETLHNVADITAPGSFPGHAELDTDVRLGLMYLPMVTRPF